MAWARSRRRKTGTYHYVYDRGRTFAAGKGKEGRDLAIEWAAQMTKAHRAEKAGMRLEEIPGPCLWTLSDLYTADMQEARRRGLRTVQPQFQGKKSKRESDWKQILAFFGTETNLDAVTGERIRQFIEARELEGTGPAAINRGLFGILRPALKLARDREESGYSKDPFVGIRKLNENRGRRQAIAIAKAELAAVVAACWKEDPKLGAHVELLRLTACRLHEAPAIDGDFLRYPPHKRGRAGSFRLEGRLAIVARKPRAFSYIRWYAAIARLPHPHLRPHDLRHSVLTILGKQPGMTLDELMKWGRWKDAQMANRYLHPDDAALSPADDLKRYAARMPKSRRGGPAVARKKPPRSRKYAASH